MMSILRGRYFRLTNKLKIRHEQLRSTLPTDLNFETTTRCNLNCRYCGREHLVRNRLMDSGEMSSLLIERVIDQFSEISRAVNSTVSICPVGLGEPLLDPRFFDIVVSIRKRIPTAKIHANTNGILLNKRNIEKVISSSLDYLVLSMNVWSREDYISLHKEDYFDLVRNNIINLLTAPRDRNFRMIVQLLDIHLNSPNISSFKEFWRQYTEPINVGIRTFHPMKDHIRRIMSTEELDMYLKYLGKDDTRLMEDRHPCYALFGTCVINKDGYIFPCCMGLWYGHDSDICLGNINDVSIREVYEKDGTLRKLRKLHLQGRWNEIDACKSCSGGRTEGSTNIFFRVGKRWV